MNSSTSDLNINHVKQTFYHRVDVRRSELPHRLRAFSKKNVVFQIYLFGLLSKWIEVKKKKQSENNFLPYNEAHKNQITTVHLALATVPFFPLSVVPHPSDKSRIKETPQHTVGHSTTNSHPIKVVSVTVITVRSVSNCLWSKREKTKKREAKATNRVCPKRRKSSSPLSYPRASTFHPFRDRHKTSAYSITNSFTTHRFCTISMGWPNSAHRTRVNPCWTSSKFSVREMASSSPNRSADDIVDTTPLLSNSGGSSDESNSGRRFVQRQSLRQAARFLRQASSRRLMREPSMLVRETAAEQLEERQSDWAYSKPVVVLDIIWNFAFVVVAATVMVLSWHESPEMPLRLWIVGYALQCMLHMVCVCIEFRRRQCRQNRRFSGLNSAEEGIGSPGNSSPRSRDDSSQYVSLADHLNEEGTRYVLGKLCQNLYISLSCLLKVIVSCWNLLSCYFSAWMLMGQWCTQYANLWCRPEECISLLNLLCF